MIFERKTLFFLVEKIMLILRLPHSFGVCGCWGRSKTIDFAIFRVLGTPKSMILARFLSIVPTIKNPNNILFPLCTVFRTCHKLDRLESLATCRGKVFLITVHSIFSFFRFQNYVFRDFLKMCIFSIQIH